MTKVIDTYSSNDSLVPYYVARNNRVMTINKNAQVIMYVCSINHTGNYELLADNIKNACMNVIVGSMQRRGFYVTDTYLLNYIPDDIVPVLADDAAYEYGSYLDVSMQVQKKTSAKVVSTFETLNVKKAFDSGAETFIVIVGFDKRETNDDDVYVSQYADMSEDDVQVSTDSLQTYLTNLSYDVAIDSYLYCGTEDDLESFTTGDKRLINIQSSLKRTRDYGSNSYTLVTGETEAADSATDGDNGEITDKFIKVTTEEQTA